MILASSVPEMRRISAAIEATLASMKQHENELRLLVDDQDREQLDKFASQWEEWQANHREVRGFLELNSDVQAKQLAVGKGQERFSRWLETLQLLAAEQPGPSAVMGLAARDSGEARSAPVVAPWRHVTELLRMAAEFQQAEQALILADTDEEIEVEEKRLAQLEQAVSDQFAVLSGAWGSGERRRLDAASQAYQAYQQTLAEIRALVGQKGNLNVRQFANEIGGPIAVTCEQLLNDIISKNENDLQNFRHESLTVYRKARNSLFAFSTAGIALSVAVTFLTGQRIARSVGHLTEYVRAVESTGDLSLHVPHVSSDEIGELASAFDRMRAKLHQQTSKLAKLNRSLEQKNREMEQFFYTVSHDLSSPLVSCKGLLGLIKEDVQSGNYEELPASTERMDRAVDQLRQIIDDLLSLSRIGRKRLQRTEVNVVALIDELGAELADRLEQVHARIEVEGRLPRVFADAKDLRRVFENLLTNAIKYGCDVPNPVISVGASITHDELRYFVRDWGKGIDPKFQEKVFGLFQRLDSDKPGTGLGLASVAKIMQVHGGRAWVEPTPGQGATFWVAFPASHDPF
ncbi:MAG: ATP-binding protein [Pirellulaceae bacterium]